VVAAIIAPRDAAAQTKLLRFPDINGNQVAFTYAGDLWLAPVAGGTATRLTSHPGLELFAKFSPDGKSIAFTGQYDGDEQVYVIPVTGGTPTQLTHYPARGPLAERWGYDNQIDGWTPDGKRIVFRSWREAWTNSEPKLYTVSPEGGSAVPLPMPTAGSGDFSADGRQIVYSPVFRDFRPEKRYSGGQANTLYLFELASNKAKKISQGPRAERDAMWIGKTIYFNSDRDGTFNLYGYDTQSGTTAQVTRGTTWDVRWPSSDNQGRIVYELNGELQVLDVASGRSTPIRISVPTDAWVSRPSRVSAAGLIEGFGLSPKGERALFVARGDVFTAPVKTGYTRNLTHSPGAHDREAAWSPDGRTVAFISDTTGEEEIYIVPQDGSAPPTKLTSGGAARRFALVWSPDASRIAFYDKDGKLFALSIADRKLTEVAHDPRNVITDYTWSPRGNQLAFSMSEPRYNTRSINIWTSADAKVHPVTIDGFDEYSPAWDPEGSYLYYLSDRDYQPQLSTLEFNFAGNRTTGIFALSLRKDVAHPFPPESDEVQLGSATDSTGGPKPAPAPSRTDTTTRARGDSATRTPPARGGTLTIDFDGIAQRAVRVPLEADNINALSATKGNLVYLVTDGFYYGRQSPVNPSLRIYTLKTRRQATIAEDVNGYALSADGSKVMVQHGASQGGAYAVYDAAANATASRANVATTGLTVDRVPAEEWSEIFDEVWRRYRDYFYAKNMHGYDWEALRRQYKPLLQYVGHRADLNYVIQEMISELTVQHAYIVGGDWQNPPRPPVALPGARFEVDSAAKRYRIAAIYPGQNEEPNYRSPLTEIGVNASAGDYVLAVDGEELTASDDIYRLLRYKAHRPVMLTLNRRPAMQGARTVSYRPVTSESDLIYLTMVLAKRRMVDSLTNGRIGYIHVPDMGAAGIREFIKWYYPQLRKEGMIVDVRANGGGNVSAMLIERLRRSLLGTQFTRTSDEAFSYPGATFVGPMVAILNENSSSDGDIFPAMFKQAGLGPLIGKRSWGGVVGITDHGPLIDGGTVNVPEFALADTAGKYIIEGYGVDPDIEVEQDVSLVIAGRDPQLERAVQETRKLMAANPRALPKRPADPVKTPAVLARPKK
jgi:tricorn protease